MFDFLKKGLKQAVEKVAKVFKEEPKGEILTEQAGAKEESEAGIKAQEIPAPQEEPKSEALKELEERREERFKEQIRREIREEAQPATEVQTAKETEPEKIAGTKERILEEMQETKIKPDIKAETPEEQVQEAKEKHGLLRGLLEKVTKKVTETKLSAGEVDKFAGELQVALLQNDVSLETAEQICDEVKEQLAGKSVKRGEAEKAIKEALKNAILGALKQEKAGIEELVKSRELTTVIFFGFNGSGKTTTIAKLAHKFRSYKPVVAAGDTFRAASIEQLEEHSKKAGFDLIKHTYGSDSAAVIFDAKKHAASKGSRLVLADTAGRSHSNANLMDELKKVVRVNKPDLKILVLDSLTGNDIYDQSKLFNDAVGVDAIILTKADVYEKGGAALSASHTIGKPILYLGTGQGYGDLEEFDAEKIVKNLMD